MARRAGARSATTGPPWPRQLVSCIVCRSTTQTHEVGAQALDLDGNRSCAMTRTSQSDFGFTDIAKQGLRYTQLPPSSSRAPPPRCRRAPPCPRCRLRRVHGPLRRSVGPRRPRRPPCPATSWAPHRPRPRRPSTASPAEGGGAVGGVGAGPPAARDCAPSGGRPPQRHPAAEMAADAAPAPARCARALRRCSCTCARRKPERV